MGKIKKMGRKARELKREEHARAYEEGFKHGYRMAKEEERLKQPYHYEEFDSKPLNHE